MQNATFEKVCRGRGGVWMGAGTNQTVVKKIPLFNLVKINTPEQQRELYSQHTLYAYLVPIEASSA